MANITALLLAASLSFACPESPPSPRSLLSDTGDGPINLSKLPGGADHGGNWLKQVCSERKTDALCNGYIRGLIDTLDFWKIRDANYFVQRMKYSDIRAGVRDYLLHISMTKAEKHDAPELLLGALNSKFPLSH